MPNFQDNHLALLRRQLAQAAHRLAFTGGFVGRTLKPAARLKFPGHPSPERAVAVQGAIAKGPDQVPVGLGGCLGHSQQRGEHLMNDIFRLAVPQAEGTAIEDQAGGLCLVERFAPGTVGVVLAQVFYPTDTASRGFVCRGEVFEPREERGSGNGMRNA